MQTLDLFGRLSKTFPRGKVPREQTRRCAIVEEWENRETGKDLFDELDGCFHRQSESVDALITRRNIGASLLNRQMKS